MSKTTNNIFVEVSEWLADQDLNQDINEQLRRCPDLQKRWFSQEEVADIFARLEADSVNYKSKTLLSISKFKEIKQSILGLVQDD